MPVNKNALIRHRVIDRCLSNRQRRWTLEDLINACTAALREYNSDEAAVSKRTIQLDLQHMRSGELGYEAPIVVNDKKYYTYSDPSFSIFSLPISEGELERLSEVVNILKQFSGFSHFDEVADIVKKLEDKIDAALKRRKPVIELDQNDRLKGLHFLDEAYKAVLNKQVLDVSYQPFGRSAPLNIIIHPYLLKVFQNRWYIVGFSQYKRKVALLALDRIVRLECERRTSFIENNFFNPELYFRDVIGVTVHLDRPPTEIIFFLGSNRAPYVLTKPLHPSQRLLAELPEGMLLSITVRINYELIERFHSLLPHVIVLKPAQLSQQLAAHWQQALQQQQDAALRARLWRIFNQTSSQP